MAVVSDHPPDAPYAKNGYGFDCHSDAEPADGVRLAPIPNPLLSICADPHNKAFRAGGFSRNESGNGGTCGSRRVDGGMRVPRTER